MLLPRIVLALVLLLLPTAALAGCGDDAGGDEQRTTATTEGDPSDAEDDTPGIVIAESIAGIAIDDGTEEVEEVLGEADSSREFANEISGASDTVLEWDDPAVEVTMAPDQPIEDRDAPVKHVVQVSTTDDVLRTSEGIGVGSSREDVETAYPEVDCDAGEPAICRLAGEENLVTDFFVEDGAVTRVVVGRVID